MLVSCIKCHVPHATCIILLLHGKFDQFGFLDKQRDIDSTIYCTYSSIICSSTIHRGCILQQRNTSNVCTLSIATSNRLWSTLNGYAENSLLMKFLYFSSNYIIYIFGLLRPSQISISSVHPNLNLEGGPVICRGVIHELLVCFPTQPSLDILDYEYIAYA